MGTHQSTTVSLVEYRAIPGFPGYRIGDDGSVWSQWHRQSLGYGGGIKRVQTGEWAELKQQRSGDVHRRVDLCRDGTVCQRLVHRLVLEAFVGPCPLGMECCHNDGDPTNNRLGNLRWDTRKANRADAIRHGTHPCGERSPAAKLTAEQVRAIRREFATGRVTKTKLANDYGIARSTLQSILTGETWRHM